MAATTQMTLEWLLGDLDDDVRGSLLARARVRRFRRGEVLVRQGAFGDGIMLLRSGSVKVTVMRGERPALVALRGPGDVIGELATIDGRRRSASVIAIGEVEAATIDGDDFRTAIASAPAAAARVQALLAARLRESTTRDIDHSALDVTGRMAARVLELAQRFGERRDDGTVHVQPPISRAELASWAGGSREQGARALRALRDASWIETPGRAIVVRDREALERLVGPGRDEAVAAPAGPPQDHEQDQHQQPNAERAWLTIAPGTQAERDVPVGDRLFVGRECAGVPSSQRLLLDDPLISRDHLELRVGPGGVLLIDESANGTWINRRRVERGEPIQIGNGDLIELGGVELLVRFVASEEAKAEEALATIRVLKTPRLAIVVGDVVGYTALTERLGAQTVAAAVGDLLADLRELLGKHHGTVASYHGDAIFTAWDADRDELAPARAIEFALAANELVGGRAAAVAGEPLRMGWGVTLGGVAAGGPAQGGGALHGDVVNLAFRLAGLAGRDDHDDVLITADAAAAAPTAAVYAESREVSVRGRTATVTVRGARQGP